MQPEYEIPRVEPGQQALETAGSSTPVVADPAPACEPLPGVIRHRPLSYEAGPTTIPILRFGGELPISLTYSVQQQSKTQPADITLRAEIAGTDIALTTAYTVPCDFKVRAELPIVEQTLYDFIGEVIRADEQHRRATAVESQVSTLEDLTAHPQLREPYAQAGLLRADDPQSVSPDTIKEFIATVMSLTRVTSLTYQDFIASQSIGEKQIEQLLDSDHRKTAASLLNNLVGLMEQKSKAKVKARDMQLVVLDHLQRVNDSTRLIGAADAEQIIERLVPAFLAYHKAQRRLPKFPDNIVKQAVRSAALGYVIAWLGNNVLGEATVSHLSAVGQGLVNSAFGTQLNYPAMPFVWAVSGTAIFVWHYLRFPFAYLHAHKNIARLKQGMLGDLNLTLQPSDRNLADFARYAEVFRNKTTIDDGAC